MKSHKDNEKYNKPLKRTKPSVDKVKTLRPKTKSSNKKIIASKEKIDKNSQEYKDSKLKAVEKRKTRSRNITMGFFTLLIMLFTIGLIFNVMQQGTPKPQFMFILEGSIEKTVNSQAIITRDEVVINAPVSGIVKPVISEGTRVSFAQTVAVILDGKSDDTLVSLRNTEQQIAELQIELINQGKGTGARVIYDEADREISEIIDLVRKDTMQQKLGNMDSYKSSISVLMERRDVKLLTVNFNDSRLDDLKKQKEHLESQLGIVAGTMSSKNPGIISYHLDGLEGVLTLESLDEITVIDYNKYLTESNIKLTAGNKVEKNEPLARITKGIYHYIVIKLDSSFRFNLNIGDNYEILSHEMGTSIPNCEIINIIEEGDDMLVVLKSDRQLERFSDKRIFNASIVIEEKVGMKIPFNSIMEFSDQNNTGTVFIVSEGYVRSAPVRIIDYDREYAIIEPIEGSEYSPSMYGYLVKNPSSVSEGESIGGAR